MTTDRAPLPAGVDGLPAVPPEAVAVLDAGLDGLGLSSLGVPERAALLDHLRLLLAWTQAINLTSVRDPVDAVRVHALDSLAGLAVLRARSIDAFVDLGSGGGLPGIPLAVALPARRVLLVEATTKKARFLEAAVGVARLVGRVEVAAARAEDVAADPRQRERWPAVTARAVAALADLVELAFPLLVPGGLLLAWKSADQAGELADAGVAVGALGGGTIRVVPAGLEHAPDHVLVEVVKRGPTERRWPRPPAERRRHPWRAASRADAHNRAVPRDLLQP